METEAGTAAGTGSGKGARESKDTVVVTPLRAFSRSERAEVAEEGEQLAVFLSDGESARVRVGREV